MTSMYDIPSKGENYLSSPRNLLSSSLHKARIPQLNGALSCPAFATKEREREGKEDTEDWRFL